jgi:hypothetical protein
MSAGTVVAGSRQTGAFITRVRAVPPTEASRASRTAGLTMSVSLGTPTAG